MTPEELKAHREWANDWDNRGCGTRVLMLCDDMERLQKEAGFLEANAQTDIPALVAIIKRLQREKREALEVARRFGGIDGNHHENWVIDQMVRELTGPDYLDFVRRAKTGGYDWDEGIAP